MTADLPPGEYELTPPELKESMHVVGPCAAANGDPIADTGIVKIGRLT
jgi:hypothetical protein